MSEDAHKRATLNRRGNIGEELVRNRNPIQSADNSSTIGHKNSFKVTVTLRGKNFDNFFLFLKCLT